MSGPAATAAAAGGSADTRYGPAVIRALVAIWTATGYPWSMRLQALLPTWLPWARRRLAVSPATEAGLRRISARQMDRVLAPHKRTIGGGRMGAPSRGPCSSTTFRCAPTAGP